MLDNKNNSKETENKLDSLNDLFRNGVVYHPYNYEDRISGPLVKTLKLLQLVDDLNGEIIVDNNNISITFPEHTVFEEAVDKKRLALMEMVGNHAISELERFENFRSLQFLYDEEIVSFLFKPGEVFRSLSRRAYFSRLCTLYYSEEEQGIEKEFYNEAKDKYNKITREKGSFYTGCENIVCIQDFAGQFYKDISRDIIKNKEKALSEFCSKVKPIFELSREEHIKLVDNFMDQEVTMNEINLKYGPVDPFFGSMSSKNSSIIEKRKGDFLATCFPSGDVSKSNIAFANAHYLVRRLRLEGADVSSAEGIRKHLDTLG